MDLFFRSFLLAEQLWWISINLIDKASCFRIRDLSSIPACTKNQLVYDKEQLLGSVNFLKKFKNWVVEWSYGSLAFLILVHETN